MLRKEGGNVFGLGSRTPIAITILVKRPDKTSQASIFYHDIGDYIPQHDKLKLIKELGSFYNPALELSSITPIEDKNYITFSEESNQGYSKKGLMNYIFVNYLV